MKEKLVDQENKTIDPFATQDGIADLMARYAWRVMTVMDPKLSMSGVLTDKVFGKELEGMFMTYYWADRLRRENEIGYIEDDSVNGGVYVCAARARERYREMHISEALDGLYARTEAMSEHETLASVRDILFDVLNNKYGSGSVGEEKENG